MRAFSFGVANVRLLEESGPRAKDCSWPDGAARQNRPSLEDRLGSVVALVKKDLSRGSYRQAGNSSRI
jgi:hypothetical protein